MIRNEGTDCLVVGEGWHDYPHPDMEPSFVEICISNDNSTRYMFSNGLPNHSILSSSERPKHCTVPFAAAMPFAPIYDATYLEENPVAGPLGFALNGVPFVDSAWAVDNGFLFEDESWNGHSNEGEFYWHYHSSRMPPSGDYPDQEELVGFAMDGFPIYGPIMEDNSLQLLDECNGRLVDGNYRYHMIKMEDIDFTRPRCNDVDPRVHNWKPIIGCFRGNTSQSRVWVDDGNREGMICSSPQVNEHIFVGLPEVGDWGGTCTCPNGEVYQVGDNNDGCQTLACIGGVAGSCTGDNPGGAGYRVICGTMTPTLAPVIPAPTETPTETPTAPVPVVTSSPQSQVLPTVGTITESLSSTSSALDMKVLSIVVAMFTAVVMTLA